MVLILTEFLGIVNYFLNFFGGKGLLVALELFLELFVLLVVESSFGFNRDESAMVGLENVLLI